MTQIKAVIAQRVYELNEVSKVSVRIFQPEKTLDGSDYVCAFHINGLSKDHQSYAIGVDTLQALLLALAKVGVILDSSEEYRSGTLRWYGSADLGLPVPNGFEM